MATFVLVHGAWHGGWCWKRVRPLLQARGHEVFTPTLTGLGERAHLLSRDVNLETHIADVVNLIRYEELTDVVLCGHSYGGWVIAGAADRIVDRIGGLVYLDAFVPENGQSVHDALAPAMREAQLSAAREHGDGWKVPPLSAEYLHVNENDREWVNRQCTPQPLAAFQQPIQLAGALDQVRHVTYILANGWGSSPFLAFYEKAKARGWKTLTIACGHDAMLDHPGDLADALTSLLPAGAASAD